MVVDVTQLLTVPLFFLHVFLKGRVGTPPATAEIKTWILINTRDLFLCGMRWFGGDKGRKIFGGVSDERQLEIRRKRKKIQEKLSNGEKNVIS